jgi:hypothetical protein
MTRFLKDLSALAALVSFAAGLYLWIPIVEGALQQVA